MDTIGGIVWLVCGTSALVSGVSVSADMGMREIPFMAIVFLMPLVAFAFDNVTVRCLAVLLTVVGEPYLAYTLHQSNTAHLKKELHDYTVAFAARVGLPVDDFLVQRALKDLPRNVHQECHTGTDIKEHLARKDQLVEMKRDTKRYGL